MGQSGDDVYKKPHEMKCVLEESAEMFGIILGLFLSSL